MNYVTWAVMYEGSTDRAYFDVLIPRAIEWLTLGRGSRITEVSPYPVALFPRRDPRVFARMACQAAQSFHLMFVHADSGGRSIEQSLPFRGDHYCLAMQETCNWPPARCIVISPRKETEAWVLGDRQAIAEALGYADTSKLAELPRDAKVAERLPDPKAKLTEVIRSVTRGRRRANIADIFPAVAQRQSFEALLKSESFRGFVAKLGDALSDFGILE
jgi:hypothetical protein